MVLKEFAPKYDINWDVIILPPLLSCSALNFVSKHLNDEQLLEVTLRAMPLIKAAGFGKMEVYLRKASLRQLARLVNLSVKEGLQIHSVHFHKPLLNHGTLQVLAKTHNLMEAAQYLGARLGVLHPPVKQALSHRLEICRKVLESVLPRAESLGFVITLENLGRDDSLDLICRLVREYPSPSLGVTLDLKFLHASGHTLEQAFQALGPKIRNVHINDYADSLFDAGGKRKYPRLGSGQVDFKKLAALCAENQFSGVWTLETLLEGDREAELAEDRVWLLKLFGNGYMRGSKNDGDR